MCAFVCVRACVRAREHASKFYYNDKTTREFNSDFKKVRVIIGPYNFQDFFFTLFMSVINDGRALVSLHTRM